jgi:hypothetical protein
MEDAFANIDFHHFVNNSLSSNNYKITGITKELMHERLEDFMNFVNNIRKEYNNVYGWDPEPEEYFLNPMIDKWKYSFAILDSNNNICFTNFSSVYGDVIHNHCTYAGGNSRGLGFAKLHMIKLCQTGMDNGFRFQEGYWPKTNNRSIILFLQMGWQIDKIDDSKRCVKMKADLEKVRNKTYSLLTKTQKSKS